MADLRRVQLPFDPRKHQREAHAKRKRFSVLVWHRRAGKSVFAVMEIILGALATKRERARFGYIGPLLKQTKRGIWDYVKHYLQVVPGVSLNESDLTAELSNGARISLFGADNPDSLRNLYFDGVVLDEVAQMKPAVWGEIVRPALTDREGWAIFIGTPKGVNLFSETYYRALSDPEWYADLKRVGDTDAIAPEEVEKAKREMSASQFAQEFECDFAASVDNALLKLDEVLASQKRAIKRAEYLYAPKVLGVDVARYGDDRSVIFPRQGLAAMVPKVFHGLDTMELAGQVARSMDKWESQAVFVDQGGIGAGVLDRLNQLGKACIGVDFGSRALDARYENRRVEMWDKMADWIRAGGCLPESTELAGELSAPTYTYANARGRMQLESKDDMRARGLPSPDLADGLCLTFAAPVGAPSRTAGLPGARSSAAAVTEYDPYQTEEAR